MKLENTTPAKRYNLTITFTPDEQDHLRAILERIGGFGPVRKTANSLFDILMDNGAEDTYLEHATNSLYVKDPNQ